MYNTNNITLWDNKHYYDNLAYFEARHWWSAAVWEVARSWLRPALRALRGLRVLDAGSGAGGVAARLAEEPAIDRVIALDPSAFAACTCGGRGLDALRGSVVQLPFADQSFDVVTCNDVLQHLATEDDFKACREIRRVLKTGGLALVRTNAHGRYTRPGHHERTYDENALRTLFADAGLRVTRMSRLNTLASLAADYLTVPRPADESAGGLDHDEFRAHRPRSARARVLRVVSQAEARVIGRLGISSRWGHTLLTLCVAH